MMTNYLFISNSSNFKIDNNLINQINLILDNQNIKFSNKEIVKSDFYEWTLEKFHNNVKNKIDNIFKNLPFVKNRKISKKYRKIDVTP